MALAMTPAEFSWISEEVSALLADCGIQRVFETGKRRRVLQCRRPGQTILLLIETDPDVARMHAVETRATQPERPAPFTMLMRKWIQGMFVTRTHVIEGDRILIVRGSVAHPDWEPPEDDEDLDSRPKAPRADVALVIELLGRQTNLFVLDAQETILGMERPDNAPRRSLSVGDVWHAPPPPPTDRASQNRFEALGAHPSSGATSPQKDEESVLAQHAPRSARVVEWFETVAVDAFVERHVTSIRSRLKRRAKKLRRLVANIEADLERATQAVRWRTFGELLQSAYGRVERGQESVSVPDYYQEGMPEVSIPLDPALSLQENIDYYFRQYKRLHDATDQIEERLFTAMEALEEVEAARGSLSERASGGLDFLLEWSTDLERRGVIEAPSEQRARAKTGANTRKKPYRLFVSGRGTSIFVGKGAAGNDEVSTHIARGRDLWFHARDWAGAHVVLRVERGGEPAPQDILDAATLAAHFSKGREDTLVDVTYTEAKYVRKPKGYPAGMVTVADGSTIGVRIEPTRLARLLSTET